MTFRKIVKSFLKRMVKYAFIDKEVDCYFHRFYWSNPKQVKDHLIISVLYLFKLNFAQYRQRCLDDVRLPPLFYQGQFKAPSVQTLPDRLTFRNLIKQTCAYGIISFDIFDTLIFRSVENPTDIFTLVGLKINCAYFKDWRIDAERVARAKREIAYGDREVTLDEIYAVLQEKYGISQSVKQIEILTEIERTLPNPLMLNAYKYFLSHGKKIVLTSDMYLSREVIKKILEKCGYLGYSVLFLSNEYRLSKGSGALQKVLLEKFPNQKIVHIGDSLYGDIKKFRESGIDAIYSPFLKTNFAGKNTPCMYASVFNALLNNLENGNEQKKAPHYLHGYRVGGILTFGYCQFLDKLAKEKGIDKILFCARDCFILERVYKKYFNNVPNAYLEISRNSIFKVTLSKNFNDFINRFCLKFYNEYRSKTLMDFLKDTGFEYLIPHLEERDFDKYFFVSNFTKKDIENLLISFRDLIIERYQSSKQVAINYFSNLIGDSKNILIVDIGWSGTCISAVNDFIKDNFINKKIRILGALMCTSMNQHVTEACVSESLSAYVYSPVKNLDLSQHMMSRKDVTQLDLVRLPLEYTFTAPCATLLEYSSPKFLYSNNQPKNFDQINLIHQGILDFCSDFKQYTVHLKGVVPPYLAFEPFANSLKSIDYQDTIYKDFIYDPQLPLGADERNSITFHQFLSGALPAAGKTLSRFFPYLSQERHKNLLFITPDMTYTGSPRSLLRMVKVAQKLGYNPIVWSQRHGAFEKEFQKIGINVSVITEKELAHFDKCELKKHIGLIICNTIFTFQFAEYFEAIRPTCWYIREATNIGRIIRRNSKCAKFLQKSTSIVCVSEYAKKAIQSFTTSEVKIIKNCIEDESALAVAHTLGDRVKFIQMGTIEYRKGYDVLLSAYQSLPESYKRQCDIYFAGGFIDSDGPYASNLLSKIQKYKNIHYLGLIKDINEKIRVLSSMDVVIVASRDESCSLVALEGAMLSKPLIVTENVGAKYMVDEENGLIVNSNDANDLKNAMMELIDNKEKLAEMGIHSRKNYESLASMNAYVEELKALYKKSSQNNYHPGWKLSLKPLKSDDSLKRADDLVVSVTSYPERIGILEKVIDSILKQTVLPGKILIYLSKDEFSNTEDIPSALSSILAKRKNLIRLCWVKGNLKSHKKYFYAMKEYRDCAVLTIDDDQIYPSNMIEILYSSYKKFPGYIHCNRANLMTFRNDGTLRCYSRWLFAYKHLLETPSMQLLPTGVGGVLYPPGSIPPAAFDSEAIKQCCIQQDDLWLKFWSVVNGVKVVVPEGYVFPREIPDSQKTALWKSNIGSGNDLSCKKILALLTSKGYKVSDLLDNIRKDRAMV